MRVRVRVRVRPRAAPLLRLLHHVVGDVGHIELGAERLVVLVKVRVGLRVRVRVRVAVTVTVGVRVRVRVRCGRAPRRWPSSARGR